MATVNYTETALQSVSSKVIKWTPLNQTDTDGQAYQPKWGRDLSVQVTGTFGGATVVLQGSNDGSTWATLTDHAGNAVSFTAAGLKSVAEATAYVRPLLSGGSGSTITVNMATGGKE